MASQTGISLSEALGNAAGPSTGLGDVNTQLKLGNQNMSQLIATIAAVFPRVTTITGGTFTLGAAATTTVAQPSTAANSVIIPFPTNAAAGTLMGSTKHLYISARTANTSFAVSTASGVAAAGTETFLYLLVTI